MSALGGAEIRPPSGLLWAKLTFGGCRSPVSPLPCVGRLALRQQISSCPCSPLGTSSGRVINIPTAPEWHYLYYYFECFRVDTSGILSVQPKLAHTVFNPAQRKRSFEPALKAGVGFSDLKKHNWTISLFSLKFYPSNHLTAITVVNLLFFRIRYFKAPPFLNSEPR